MRKVLIPAMEKRSSLICCRSLGKRGIEVIGCSHEKLACGFFSKYCKKRYIYFPPTKDIEKYKNDIQKIIDKEKPDVVFPINEETILPLIGKISFPFSDQNYKKVQNKLLMTKIAQNIGIPCPKLNPKTFPIVARPIFSKTIKEKKVVSYQVHYLLSKKDFSKFHKKNYFFQEYIPGQGYGFYALFDRGEPKAYFMLKRIHEVPFTGGPSSLRESVYEERLKNYGIKLLKKLKWHGVAMVEFRRDKRDGEFKFIEINGRFWGSLALSVVAGVDFPYLLYKLSQGEKIEETFNYKLGVKCRWLFGDVAYLLSVYFGRKIDTRPSRIKSLLEFFNFFQKDLYYDYFQKDDLTPALVNIILSFKRLFKKLIL